MGDVFIQWVYYWLFVELGVDGKYIFGSFFVWDILWMNLGNCEKDCWYVKCYVDQILKYFYFGVIVVFYDGDYVQIKDVIVENGMVCCCLDLEKIYVVCMESMFYFFEYFFWYFGECGYCVVFLMEGIEIVVGVEN